MVLAARVGMDAGDFAALWIPTTPLLELVIRGSVVYLALFFLLRFIVKREAGSLGVTDLLVIVLIADAAQNAMGDEYQSITGGLVLVGTIVGWSYLLDALAYRYPIWRKIVRPPPIQLIRDGELVRANLGREKITDEELLGELRANGIEDIKNVRSAYIESDGMISVITTDQHRKVRRKQRTAGLRR